MTMTMTTSSKAFLVAVNLFAYGLLYTVNWRVALGVFLVIVVQHTARAFALRDWGKYGKA